jgi:glycosyltransferase involved in cell wall biosynthesis
MDKKIRSCIISPEIVGPHKNGGVGTHSYYLTAFLSEELGQDVTFLYTGWIECKDEAHWREWFRHHLNVEFVWLPRPERLDSVPVALRCTYLQVAGEVYRWLRDRKFDVCHFQEMHGNGYRCFQAKRLGLAFAATVLVCTVHSSWEWICQAMQCFPQSGIEELQTKFMERYCTEHSDLLISPSQHMLDWLDQNHVKTPAKRFILPYLFDPALNPVGHRKPDHHLVFFGRLEVRKGLILFLETLLAMDRERAFAERQLRVTFLGRPGFTPDGTGLDTIRKYRRYFSPGIGVSEQTDLGQPEALAYLVKHNDALVVCPSLVDNSPFALIESLQLGLNVIAAKSGGIPELFAGEDRLFEPRTAALAAKIRAGLNNELPPPAKRYDLKTSARMWRDFCEQAVPGAGRLSPQPARANPPTFQVFVAAGPSPDSLAKTLAALDRQTHRNFSVVVVSAATKSGTEAPDDALRAACLAHGCKWLGETVDALELRGRSEVRDCDYAVFVGPGCYPRATMLASLAGAFEASGVDALTSCVEILNEPTNQAGVVYEPLGGFLEGGVFRNFFGAGCFALRKEHAPETLAELRTLLRPEGAWICLVRLSMAGRQHEVVPETLADLESAYASFSTIDLDYEGQMEVLSGYQAGLPVWVHYFLLNGVATERRLLALDGGLARNGGNPSAAQSGAPAEPAVKHSVAFKIKRETRRFLRQCRNLPQLLRRNEFK